jgi:glutamate-1-semialdehyde aminotransferase
MNERVYPAGTGTYSKGQSQFPGNAPRFAVSGRGSRIICSDGQEYIDWTAGLGAIVLGYADPDVNAAVAGVLARGNIFGLPHAMEFELAEVVADLMPWPDAAVRFGKHGSDVTSAAIRAARHLTGRKAIISHGYHGYHDGLCPNPNGTVSGIWTADWDGKTPLTQQDLSNVAAVIIEPDGVPDLVGLRKACTEAGALLVFDEVLTGFRMPGYTFAKNSGVTPDYITLAKAISNGIPLSAIAGPYDLMQPFAGDIGFSFTYGGELTGIAAGLATIDKFKREPVIERLWTVGFAIRDAWDRACERHGILLPLNGLTPRTVVAYPSLAHKTLFTQQMWARGVAWTVGATAMFAHTGEDVDKTISAINESLGVLASAWDDPMRLVEGSAISLPYRQMVTV